jgi:ABC-type sugar transport system ATPase subunit
LNIIPHLSAAENMFLGRKKPRNPLGMVSLKRMVESAEKIPNALSLGADLRQPAMTLSVIQQWKLVINRALALKPRIIFMDEPTASLTYDEVKELFDSIQHLRESGTAIVYVSHRIEEIFEIADRVTVIKDGAKVGTAAVKEMDTGRLFHMMLGRELKDTFPSKSEPQDEVCLEVKNLTSGHAVRDVSFSVRRGEILGIAGLVGSGRTELARLLFGADRKDKGEIFVHGALVRINSPCDAIRCGLAMVPEERRSQGVILSMGVKNNITLSALSKLRLWSRIPVISQRKEKSTAESLAHFTDIRTPNLNKEVEFLSGGNQQKCVVAKWLCSEGNIIILDEPTRGIDIGSKVAIYKIITDLARRGAAILLISSDLTEIMGLSHRILVMDHGMKKLEIQTDETDLKTIMKYCLGENGSKKGLAAND